MTGIFLDAGGAVLVFSHGKWTVSVISNHLLSIVQLSKIYISFMNLTMELFQDSVIMA